MFSILALNNITIGLCQNQCLYFGQKISKMQKENCVDELNKKITYTRADERNPEEGETKQ